MMKWELHCHTDESSSCGKVPAVEVARVLAEAGYTGVVVTDHYNDYTLEKLFTGSPLERTRAWLRGYEQVKEAGEKLGLRVLFGLEARLPGNENDLLIFGAEPDFVLENPELHKLTLPELHALCHRYGAVMIQAHPGRVNCFRYEAEHLDGVEGFNGNPRQVNYNEETCEWAKDYPHLIVTSGSDFHQMPDLDRGGIWTDVDIRTSADMAKCLKERVFTCIEC